MFIAQIVAVAANTDLMSKAGKLCLEDAGLISYSHGEYFGLGRYLGFFGFSVASPEALKRRNEGRSSGRSAEKIHVKPARSDDGRPARSSASSGRRSAGLPGISAYEKKMASREPKARVPGKPRGRKDTGHNSGKA